MRTTKRWIRRAGWGLGLVCLAAIGVSQRTPAADEGQMGEPTREAKPEVTPRAQAAPRAPGKLFKERLAISLEAYRSSSAQDGTRSSGPGTLNTGFEPADGFAPGPIHGQAGWLAFDAADPEGHIDTVNPAAGAQHLRISKDPALPTGTATGAFSPDLGPLATGASTTSVDVAISDTGGADYIVAGQSPSERFLTWEVDFEFTGPIFVLDDLGAGLVFVNTGATWAVGPYKNLTVCDDPVAGTTDYFYDGVLIYSQVTHLPGTRVEQIVFVSDNFHIGDDGDFDNLSIASGLSALCGSECVSDADCDDHLPCTNDICFGGECQNPPVTCIDDLNLCTDEFCDPVSGMCVTLNNNDPCDDGHVCTVPDACLGGVCTGTPVVCDDGDPCTSDSCAEPDGCMFDLTPVGTPCDDRNACTVNEVCDGLGVCVGTDIDEVQIVCVTSDDCPPGPTSCSDAGFCVCNRSRICISVFRYGGVPSGWVRNIPGAVHPAGSFASISRHINRANQVFAQAAIEWVWLNGAIEDLRDPYGAGNGDIAGGPFDHERGSQGNQTVPPSPDIREILAKTADSECYPVVFVNGAAGVAGWTLVLAPPVGAPGPVFVNLGHMTAIDSDSFPQPEQFPFPFFFPTFRAESRISTLGHEFGHALCLDPIPGSGVGAWGNIRGHPAMAPENAQIVVPLGFFSDLGVSYFTHVMNSPPPPAVPVGAASRLGTEFLSIRERGLARAFFCEDALRARFSPSFSVAPGGPSAGVIPHNKILWAPAVPPAAVPPPVTLGLAVGLDALSYGKDFGAGRFAYKFSVDKASVGLMGTAVNNEAIKVPAEAHGDEFAAPAAGPSGDPPAVKNLHILDEGQFGLAISDDVDALIQDSPAEPANPAANLFGPVDQDGDGNLDAGARVYFSKAADANVFVVIGNNTPAPVEKVYATRAALGLVMGDDIDALCVKEMGGDADKFEPLLGDRIAFSLTRASPSVAGALDSSDVLGPGPVGGLPVLITPAAVLGLRGADMDELNALKCFKELDPFPASKAVVEVTHPVLGTDTVTLTGPTTVEVDIAWLVDNDGDGLEEVPTEIIQLDLTGTSALFGPITLRVRPATSSPFQRSIGQIEEKSNDTPGVLDLPPFTATGAASSFFDVFFEIEVAGEILHNEQPKHMETQITEKPPRPGATYESPEVVPLFDENNDFTGIELKNVSHTPRPPEEVLCCLPPEECLFLDSCECENREGFPVTDCFECIICISDADCDDGLLCTGTETCVSGLCQSGTPLDCDDGLGCTIDDCVEPSTDVVGGCVNNPVAAGTACNDGNGCTFRDVCNGMGGCAGTDINEAFIECATSADCEDATGVAFLCSDDFLCVCEPGAIPPPLEAADDGLGGDYNRVGDFKMPASAGGQEVTIRVKLNRMYIDKNEDASQCPVRQGLPDLSVFEDQVRYLGPPKAFNNNNLADPQWVGAKLQCTPLVRDWSASALAADLGGGVDTDTIYYYGAEVVPCSIHAVQQGDQSCVDSANEEACLSVALEVRTAVWGDLWPPFNVISFTDIGKEVDAFKSIPVLLDGATKWRSMLRDNEGAPASDINFNDIGKSVDGFKTIGYPEDGPVNCP